MSHFVFNYCKDTEIEGQRMITYTYLDCQKKFLNWLLTEKFHSLLYMQNSISRTVEKNLASMVGITHVNLFTREESYEGTPLAILSRTSI